MKIRLLTLFLVCYIFVFSQNTVFKVKNSENQKKWVDSVYASLSLNEKVAQLFNVALYNNKTEKEIEQVRNLIKEEKIGGLILMQSDVTKHIDLLNEFQSYSKVPLLVGIDGEWGLAQRFDKMPFFPFSMTLAALKDESLIYLMGKRIAEDCKLVGIHWNFAPDVDINTNPLNPIIGGRAFGSKPENVVRKSLAYMNGLQDYNILTTAKHFPGHGDTALDSHKYLPIINHKKKRLDQIELYPYKKIIPKNLMGIMVGHLQVPAYEKDPNVPASLSQNIVTNLLKNELDFKGLIVTDALNMEGVVKNFPHGETDLMAFKAGNDVLLFSQAVKTGKEKIINAINSGEIPESRLEESVKKILNSKYFVGLNKYKPAKSENIIEKLNSLNHKNIIKKIHEKSITIVKNDNQNIPFVKDSSHNIVHFVLEGENFSILETNLAKFKDIKTISLQDINNLEKGTKVIISVIKNTKSVYNSYKISDENLKIAYNIAKKYHSTFVVYASPYSLLNVKLNKFKSVIVAYQNNDYTQEIIPNVLFGNQKALGILPIDL